MPQRKQNANVYAAISATELKLWQLSSIFRVSVSSSSISPELLADSPGKATFLNFSLKDRFISGSGLVLPILPSLSLAWCVYTDLIFNLFIQSRSVLAGILYFILDLLIDCPSMISFNAAWRVSSEYCLYLRTGAELRSPPLKPEDIALLVA